MGRRVLIGLSSPDREDPFGLDHLLAMWTASPDHPEPRRSVQNPPFWRSSRGRFALRQTTIAREPLSGGSDTSSIGGAHFSRPSRTNHGEEAHRVDQGSSVFPTPIADQSVKVQVAHVHS